MIVTCLGLLVEEALEHEITSQEKVSAFVFILKVDEEINRFSGKNKCFYFAVFSYV